MDIQPLITAGLLPQQAEAYALLLDSGGTTASEGARELGLSRTNAYKVFDRLVDLGLAAKTDEQKKVTYRPSNPLALAQLVNEARTRVSTQEEAVKQIMDHLLGRYYSKTEQPDVQTVTGRVPVAAAFRRQIDLRQPMYFVRSQSDIPSLGFETMHELRVRPAHYGQARFGITPDVVRSPTNPDSDKRSRLTRTWVKREHYTAPVEWSVSGSMLLIVLFGSEPHAITITNPIIADAFRQLWHIMDAGLRALPGYSQLPRADNRSAA